MTPHRSENASLYVPRLRGRSDSTCRHRPPLPQVVHMPRVARRTSTLLSNANLRRRVQRRVPGAAISGKALSVFTAAAETYLDDLADGAGFEWLNQVASRRLQGSKVGQPRLSARHVLRALEKQRTTPKVKPDGAEVA